MFNQCKCEKNNTAPDIIIANLISFNYFNAIKIYFEIHETKQNSSYMTASRIQPACWPGMAYNLHGMFRKDI